MLKLSRLGSNCGKCWMLFALLMVTSHSAVAQTVVYQQSAYWNSNGHTYIVLKFNQGIDWDWAKNFGVQHGGYLATITSSAENSFISQFISEQICDNIGERWWFECPWLGGYFSGGWKWISGEPWGFTSWGNLEPNYGACGGPYFLSTKSGDPFTSFHWNDVDYCSFRTNALFEFNFNTSLSFDSSGTTEKCEKLLNI